MGASKEFIRYVQEFAKKLDKASRLLGDIVLEDEKDITALAVEFVTKKRVMELSSSPRSFRSKRRWRNIR